MAAKIESEKKKVSYYLNLAGEVFIFLSLLTLFFIYGPATKEEIVYQARQALVKSDSKLAKEIEPPNTEFSIVIPKIGASAPVFANVDPFNASEYLPVLKKGLKNIFASILFLLVFSLFAPFAKAFSDYVSITKLSSYINKEDFKISYAALSENPISAQFYVRKDGDSSWRTLGSALTGASGYVQVSGSDIYNGDGKYFFKVVINGGTAEDETSTIVDRQAPDAVRDYRKEKLGDGHYKLYWRNPDNEDFDKVIIYRSDSTNFTADSSTEVATIWGSKDTEMTSENAAAPGKEYYFAIRAIDKAGNASSVVSDPETQVSAGSVLGASVSATSTPEVVKILPKEKKTGEVLGEEKTEEATPSPTLTPQEEKGGVLGQAVKFAKDRTKLTVGIIAVLLFAGYLVLRKFRSGGKK